MSELPKNKSESWFPPPQKESSKVPSPESAITDFREALRNRVWRKKDGLVF